MTALLTLLAINTCLVALNTWIMVVNARMRRELEVGAKPQLRTPTPDPNVVVVQTYPVTLLPVINVRLDDGRTVPVQVDGHWQEST